MKRSCSIVMSCYHPLKAFKIGVNAKTGKPNYRITSYCCPGVYLDSTSRTGSVSDAIWRNLEPGWQGGYPFGAVDLVTDFIEIPCGKCIGCRLKYSRDWADRCMLEAQYHKSNYFVTFTYSDEFLPMSDSFDLDTGEFRETPTLKKSDFQKLMKRIRRYYPGNNPIRYFSCGEYGSNTFRPHYHAILFGLELDDLQFLKKSRQGHNYYRSEFLEKCWPFGYVIVTDVTWETCAYTARYVCKKRFDDKTERYMQDFYDEYNIEKEFVLMSRRPGLARQYYEDNKSDICLFDEIHVNTSKGGSTKKPPRYFDSILENDFPEFFEHRKDLRKRSAELAREHKLRNTDLPYHELLEIEERNLLNKTKTLIRDL